MPVPGRTRRQRGFALLVVLWSVALLALIGTRLTGAARTEAQIARNQVSAATAELAADGAVRQALFQLLASGDARWPPDGMSRRLPIGNAIVDLRITSEGGKLNPNRVPAAVIAALMRRLGVPPDRADFVAGTIFDWRTPGALASAGGDKATQYRTAGRTVVPTGKPFESLDELVNVLGVTPALQALLTPFLSVHNETGIDPRFVAPPVRLALADLGIGLDQPVEARQAVLVRAEAALPDGASFVRRAIARVNGAGAERPWQILVWDQGP